MELVLSEEQQNIADSAAVFLAKASAMPVVRTISQGAEGWDPKLWQDMSDLGWCGVSVHESAGGLGLGQVERVLLQEQLGRRLACVPFFDSAVMAASALARFDKHPVALAWSQRLASGEAIMSLALPEVFLHQSSPQTASSHVSGAPLAPIARPASGDRQGWTLTGEWPQVGSAAMAHGLLLPAQTESGETMLLLVPTDAPGLQVQALQTLDGTRRMARVQVQNVVLDDSACLARGTLVHDVLHRVRCQGAIALAAEQVGVAQQCLDLTLAYTGQRHQFDRPVAGFQAVKHRCAQMLVALESARSAVYGAACMADTHPDSAVLMFYAAQARVAATEAALFCSREAIQLHGGVGFTWEFDPHFYLRRAQASSQRLGPVSWWLEQVAGQLLDAPEVAS
jgi:alkylation response protein AidB-like acyl-CoA dehydrogenase